MIAHITALALDQSPPTSGHHGRLICFLSTGEFCVIDVNHQMPGASSRIHTYQPSGRSSRTAPIVQAVYHHPLLVTLSQSFHLSLYDISADTVRHTQTLTSFTSYPPSSLVLSLHSPSTYKLVLAYAIPVYPAHWMMVSASRTARTMDVPQGWVDENKMRAMREQWGRKVARVADTQTDGKWVVLAPGQHLPVMPSSSPSSSGGSSPSTSSSSSSGPAYVSSSLHTASGLQLYRLYLPPLSSSSSPKLTFVRTLHGQIGPVSTLALADGRCVSLGMNGSIWVWDLECGTGTEVSSGITGPLEVEDEDDGEDGVNRAFEAVKMRVATGARGSVVFDDRRIILDGGGLTLGPGLSLSREMMDWCLALTLSADIVSAAVQLSMAYTASDEVEYAWKTSVASIKLSGVGDPAAPRSEHLSSAEKRDEAWKFCAVTIERHYDERLRRWNAELDMLLVFAGLFSAALTAFNVQSYLLLQPDNTDTIVLALVRISAQLEGFAVDSRFIGSSAPAFKAPQATAFSAPGYAVWMNALWFSSLACTLSAASVAVMVKQWLHQYGQGLSGNSPEMTCLRQYRYDSLVKWRVPETIAALPILLQAALCLFFAGLLILLFNLHPSVAITVSILVGALMLFTAATTVLPAYYADCCYQSPQALSVFVFVQTIRQACNSFREWVERKAHAWAVERTSAVLSQSPFLSYLRYTVQSVLSRIEMQGPYRNWQAREKQDVDAQREELEQSIALTTYKIVLDKAVLSRAVVPCLSGMDALSERMSVQYGELVLSVSERLRRVDSAAWRPVMPFVLVVLSLIVKEPRPGAVHKILASMPVHRLTSAKSNIGLLFLLAMANLVANGIAARAAFENLLSYLRNTRVDQEKTNTLGRTVLQDVEAVFPVKFNQVGDLVDLDNFTSVSHYLTGIECIVLYLLRHGPNLGVPLLPTEQRLLTMARGSRCFLSCPAWQNSHPRQESVLWALRCSRLPDILQKLLRDADTAN
ncbi:hypothetical protein BN946_scf184905.g11 [Trametes cinnabarina]|uniref:DUF6535 domain-containing protein n=1 Tax=Pycnoporus cinnabarinus TaxID=5643 RepID=A0A060SD38_PYCCI|nr:hypothetical protein BN946_scf184905.g11 [Trametes cinnabarina]